MSENRGTRVLPHSAEAERAVLGAMLRKEENLAIGLGQLVEEDFYLPAHRTLFGLMGDLHSAAKPVDEVSLVERLDQAHKLREVGGVTYVTELREALPVLGNFTYYMGLIKEKSTLRHLIEAGGEIVEDAFESDDSVERILSSAEKKIFDLSLQNVRSGLTQIGGPLMKTYIDLTERAGQTGLSGLPTGFRDLDAKLSGLQKNDLIVVAGRPAMGKTSFAMNIAQHAASREGAVVAVFSLEMSAEQLSRRMLCTEARVDMEHMRSGTLSGEEWEYLAHALKVLGDAKLYIDDTAGITLAEMRSKLRRLHIEAGGLDLVVIDYLQLMTYRGKADNRQQEIADTTRQLKIMARDLNVPIVLLSQLSRGPETRTDKRPMMSDLRESGAIEQDADIIILLYRAAAYDEEADDTALAIVAKHRNGSTGDVKLYWRGEYTMFENLLDTGDDSPY